MITVRFAGGTIAVGQGVGKVRDTLVVGLTLQPLTNSQPIGETVSMGTIALDGEGVQLIFWKTESIDIVIDQLQRLNKRFPQ